MRANPRQLSLTLEDEVSREPLPEKSRAGRAGSCSADEAEPRNHRARPKEPKPEPEPADGDVADGREALRKRLEKAFDAPVASLVLTENRSRIASAKRRGRTWELRLHRCFLEAETPVLEAIAAFFSEPPGATRRRALGAMREHFAAHHEPAPVRPPKLQPVGRVHDLGTLRDRIDREYFEDALRPSITWGRAGVPRRRRRGGGFSIRLGSYEASQRLVRIHPVLDRPEVPQFVVAAVVYHEMLHAAVPPETRVTVRGEKRRRVHNPEFRRREKLFEHHRAAEAWLEGNIERLARWRSRRS
ncbi:MAG: hypothetical protein AAF725_19805 [Acidobacteriota bacterium]